MSSLPSPLTRRLALVLALATLSACQVVPPEVRHAGRGGVVRADSAARAAEVSRSLDALEPRVRALLPDTRRVDLEVWVQESPRLYAFGRSSYEEADGFWAESLERIHLRDSAESLERTLAHELTHALLGPSWSPLPGTLEEGLCDWISAAACPEQALGMRAGRLSAAALATGGMELEVALLFPRSDRTRGFEVGYTARVLLHGGGLEPLEPSDVFAVKAGLSTSHLAAGHKKALYGLGYLLVDRIAARRGVEGLHALCLEAQRRGLDEVPEAWLLTAAGMPGGELHHWRRALQQAFGGPELGQLLGTYPHLVRETVEKSFGRAVLERALAAGSGPPRARIGLLDRGETIELSLAD